MYSHIDDSMSSSTPTKRSNKSCDPAVRAILPTGFHRTCAAKSSRHNSRLVAGTSILGSAGLEVPAPGVASSFDESKNYNVCYNLYKQICRKVGGVGVEVTSETQCESAAPSSLTAPTPTNKRDRKDDGESIGSQSAGKKKEEDTC